jgi:DNA-binding response OmpR family regulator
VRKNRDNHRFERCHTLRASEVPVLFLSARAGDADKIRGLDLGDDDYTVKTATPAEVVARVKAVLRRSGTGRPSAPPRIGRLEVDRAARPVTIAGKPARITARVFELLQVVVRHPGRCAAGSSW